MSEVKPTLVSYSAGEEIVPTNSWLSNFPSGRWIDAQSRNWYWIMVNAVNVPSAYEYRVKFDVPAQNIPLTFPFVVKTSDDGVKKVFIDGVDYRVRSKENYGNRFIVSGQEFSFKVATRYKLTRQTVPLLILEYKQAVFKNVNVLTVDNCFVLRRVLPKFDVKHKIDTNLMATRFTQFVFTTSALTTCDYIRIRTTSSTFNNVNVFSVPVIANCRDTSWQRFGGVWQSCETWMPQT